MPGTPSASCQSRKRRQAGRSIALPSSVKGVIVTVKLPRNCSAMTRRLPISSRGGHDRFAAALRQTETVA